MSSRTTDEALRRLLDEGRERAGAIGPDHARLWEALASATEGGKRFRPALLQSAHDALGGDHAHAAIEVGAALELLHTAFVIHDDVIDGDHTRRGRPNVSGTFRAQARADGAGQADADHYGRTAAILAGDLGLTTAVRTVATCGAPVDVVARLLDLFDHALHTTSAGELADVRLTLDLTPASLAESVSMEADKTGAYSFTLPLQAGAVLAGADESTVVRLGQAGRLLGIAFQLVDDLIGVFGDTALSGKSSTCDLRTRKQTPLMVHARSTPEWEQVRLHLGRELDDEELAEVRRLLTISGSRRFVEELAEAQLTTARSVFDGLGFSLDFLDTMTATMHPTVLVGSSEVAA